DVNGNYIDVNQKWLKETKFSNKIDVIGANSYDIWSKEEAEAFIKNEKQVMENRKIEIFEEKILSPIGEQIMVDTAILPVLDENNMPIGTAGISIDGKYRMKFYSNLKENERNFKEITKYSDSVFFIRDEEKVIYMSPAFETMFEESYESFANDVYKFNDFFKNEKNKNGLLENYKFDELNEGKLKAKLKNGKEKWIWYKFLPIYDDCGKPIKRIGILTDVTESVNIEEEKEKIRLDFFSNVSHELRTPINILLSSIQVLKLKLGNLDQENRDYFSKYINIMQQNSFRLLKLINNLIDSTRIDSESIQINQINANIISFIEDICYSVLNFIKLKNMNLVFDTNKEEEIISFDPDCVERVMLNLLSNAIKFNRENGNIFVNVNVARENVVVEVRDEGIGIPQDKIESIFDKFEQVKLKIKSEREGSGIGLYIAKSLVEIQGGTIKAVSEVEKGSSIIFTLPRKTIENKGIENIKKNKDSSINKAILEFSDI
ncbi:MAG: ATP-binding protein, partial [Intestinibacter sp.]